MNRRKAPVVSTELGKVYCPMCTHTVDAEIEHHVGRGAHQSMVRAGQKCPRCSGALDAGYILRIGRAA